MSRRTAALFGLVAALALGGSARATAPGQNGLIVYQATVGKHIQLFTVKADGTGARQLTRFGDSDSVHASWSADGAKIAFERDFGHRAGLYTMSQAGRDVVSLTPKGVQGMPALSPDGSKLVFDRVLPHDDALWLMNADGSGLRRLTHNARPGKDECRCEGSPVFSPDGKRVAFVRTIIDLKTAAFVVNADGTGLKQLTPWRLGVSAKLDWSPDGSRILISSPQAERPNVASNVFTIRPDGTGLTQLTHETKPNVRDLADGFSPDGTKIIFARTVADGPFQVYVMNADGTGVKQLTHGVDAHWASWGRATRSSAGAATAVDGTYLVAWTQAALVAAGASAVYARGNYGDLTWTLKGGTFVLHFATPPVCHGTYAVSGTAITIKEGPGCHGLVRAGWSLHGGQLRLHVTKATDPGDRILFGGKPWKKVA